MGSTAPSPPLDSKSKPPLTPGSVLDRKEISKHMCYPLDKLGLTLVSCDYNSLNASRITNSCDSLRKPFVKSLTIKGERRNYTNLVRGTQCTKVRYDVEANERFPFFWNSGHICKETKELLPTEAECLETCKHGNLVTSECPKPKYNWFTKRETTTYAIHCEDTILSHLTDCNYINGDKQVMSGQWTQVGKTMVFADYKCGKHTNEDIDITYDGVTDSIIDERTGLSYRNSADKVDGNYVDFGHIRLNKDEFNKKII